MARKSDILGMKELERSFERLGKVPQIVATQSARAGASIAHKAAKANAPEDTGMLKRGLVLKREKRTKLGKTVYQVTVNPAMNDEFVKVSKDGKRSYYPASQEFGFLTVDGGYVPGYRYMRRAVEENEVVIEKAIIARAKKAVDKALRG